MAQNKRTKEEYAKIAEEIREEYAKVNTYKSKLARKLNKWCANAIFKSIEKYNLECDEAHICV